MPGRKEILDAVIQPAAGQVQVVGDAIGEIANDLRGLEKRIHVFRGQARVEGENHHGAAEKAQLTGDTLFPEMVGQDL